MHEYSIVQALLAQVEGQAARHGAVAVKRLEVRIGELSGVEIDLLKTAYEMMRDRTICEGAPMDVTPVAARWECRACAQAIPHGGALRCPACGSGARLAAGDEIMLDRIELEVADV
jgi:hydrogenase nickel incorporation protein HypA/HybF